MRKIVCLIFMLGCMHALVSQNHLDLRAGFSVMNAQEWNRTVSAYNFTRPWLLEKQPSVGSAWQFGLTYSGVIGKGFFLSPQLTYQRFISEANGNFGKNRFDMRWFTGSLSLDIYPLEFGLDTVSYSIRPFVRLGAGALSALPRVYLSDSLAYSNNEIYDPVVWNSMFLAGAGCRIRISDFVDITPSFMWNYFPKVSLEGFANALHGSSSPGLNDEDSIHNFIFSLSVSLRVGKLNR